SRDAQATRPLSGCRCRTRRRGWKVTPRPSGVQVGRVSRSLWRDRLTRFRLTLTINWVHISVRLIHSEDDPAEDDLGRRPGPDQRRGLAGTERVLGAATGHARLGPSLPPRSPRLPQNT